MIKKNATIYLSDELTETQRDNAIKAVAREQFSNAALNGVRVCYRRTSRSGNSVAGLPRYTSMQVLAAVDDAVCNHESL